MIIAQPENPQLNKVPYLYLTLQVLFQCYLLKEIGLYDLRSHPQHVEPGDSSDSDDDERELRAQEEANRRLKRELDRQDRRMKLAALHEENQRMQAQIEEKRRSVEKKRKLEPKSGKKISNNRLGACKLNMQQLKSLSDWMEVLTDVETSARDNIPTTTTVSLPDIRRELEGNRKKSGSISDSARATKKVKQVPLPPPPPKDSSSDEASGGCDDDVSVHIDSSEDSFSGHKSSESEVSEEDKDHSRRAITKGKRFGSIKSGLKDKSGNSGIIRKVKDPHTQLDFEYISGELKFEELSFGQIVEGETEIVTRKHISEDEKLTRLFILKKLAYLSEYLPLKMIKDLYITVMSHVEKGKIKWSQTQKALDKLEQTVLIRNCRGPRDRTDKFDKGKQDRPTTDRTYYCAKYNKGECSLGQKHAAEIKGKAVMVNHICRQCWIKSKEKKQHPECNSNNN